VSCFHPLDAWSRLKKSGKREIWFPKLHNYESGDQRITLPCGRCIGCRLDRSRDWALRCVKEAQLHEENCFVTLTYRDEDLPHDGSLVKPHWQKFVRKLRKRISPRKVRYFHAGEYSELGRPHYHALLFGYDFKDRVIFKRAKEGNLYTSETLDDIWGKGFTSVGDVTFESAAYVARYCLKKVYGEKSDEHYERVYEWGTVFIEPEYSTMSRRPGIAKQWYDEFKDDAYPSDYITSDGRKMRPPRYFDEMLTLEKPEVMKEIKEKRIRSIKHKDNTPERLRDREIVKNAQLLQLKRSLE